MWKKKGYLVLWKTYFWLFYLTSKSLPPSSYTKLPMHYRTLIPQFHILFLNVINSSLKIPIDATKWHGLITIWRKIKSKMPHTEVHNHTPMSPEIILNITLW